MANMTAGEHGDILNTVHAMNSCEDKESFVATIMPSMMSLFRAECATFHLVEGCPRRIRVIESRSFKSEKQDLNEDKFYTKLYTEGYYRRSPLLKEAASSAKCVLKIGESISTRDWERSDLYNDFILPQNLYWELFLPLRWKKDLVGMVTLWRSKKQGDYEDGDVSRAEMLSPHLAVAVHSIITTAKIVSHQRIPAGEEENRDGILVLNHKLKLQYFNGKARHICQQITGRDNPWTPGEERDEFAVPACVIQDCSSLLDVLDFRAESPIWPKERLVITNDNGRFSTESSVIWKANQADSLPSFLVILHELEDRSGAVPNLQTGFHLSNRELDIVYFLLKGQSDSEIAERLFISKLTVHTHIKNVYRKLGARSRIDLFRYVQRLPGWLR